MTGTQETKGAPKPAFDARLARLEALVAELEEGGLGLEASIERYKEGVALMKGCRDMLDGFRQQVDELSESTASGTRPYAGDPDVVSEPER